MKYIKLNAILMALLLVGYLFPACSNWVEDVDPLISEVEDQLLDNEDNLLFVVRGVKGRFGRSGEGGGMGQLLWRASGFSDEFLHDQDIEGGAVAPDHIQFVQDAPINLDFVRGDWQRYHEIRFIADDLVDRIGRIGSVSNTALKEEGLWWGYTVGGMMRMYLAEHWGWDQNGSTPGAVISTADEWGDLLTPAQLHSLALGKFTQALTHDPGSTEGVGDGLADKIVHSFMARIYLFEEDYGNAETHAGQGLAIGDQPFQVPFTSAYVNRFWDDAGRNHSGFTTNQRFADYVIRDRLEGEILSNLKSDPDGISNSLRGPEGNSGERGNFATPNPRDGLLNSVSGLFNPHERIPLWERPRNVAAGGGEFKTSGGAVDTRPVGYAQDIYIARDTPLDIIDGREMELILAEVALQRDNDVAGMVDHINNVRAWHMLDPYTVDDANNYDNPLGGASTTHEPRARNPKNITGPLGLLIEERDKSLWMKGVRIMDERRFDLWHLDAATWVYMPIPFTESDVNPNLKNRSRDF